MQGLVRGQSGPCVLGRGLNGREAEMLLYPKTLFITVCVGSLKMDHPGGFSLWFCFCLSDTFEPEFTVSQTRSKELQTYDPPYNSLIIPPCTGEETEAQGGLVIDSGFRFCFPLNISCNRGSPGTHQEYQNQQETSRLTTSKPFPVYRHFNRALLVNKNK